MALAACGGGGGGGGGVTNDINVSVTTAGGATTVAAGQSLTVQANVQNASDTRVSWSLTGPNCPNNCGTITPTANGATYQAPASVATQFTVTVNATSVQDATKRSSVVLTVTASTTACPTNSGLLKGQYAFEMQGFDDLAPYNAIAVVGSMALDGCGNVTSGTADYAPAPSSASVSVTGTYSIQADRRGTLTVTIAGIKKTFAISLGHINNGVAARGGLTEFTSGSSANNLLSGAMWLQDPAAFAYSPLAGNFAYLLNGWGTGGGSRMAAGGTVTLDSAGNFGNGLQDERTASLTGQAIIGKTGVAWSATSALLSSTTGRAVLPSPAFDSGGVVVMYVVSANQALIVDTDAAGDVLSGQMVAQSGTFDQTSLNGSLVSNQTASDPTPGAASGSTQSVLAIFAANGAAPGTLSAQAVDINNGGNVSTNLNPNSIQYGYTVSSNGQVSVTYQGSLAGKYYLTRANSGFLLGWDNGLSIGAIRPQGGNAFIAASLSGSYFAIQAPGASLASTLASGVATSAGDGTLASTMDLNTAGAVSTSGQQIGGALAIASNGRFTDAHGNVIYIIAPSVFLAMSISGNQFFPVVLDFEQ